MLWVCFSPAGTEESIEILKEQSTGKKLEENLPRSSKNRTLGNTSFFLPKGPTSLAPQKDLNQSYLQPVRSWGSQSFGTHLYNMTLSHGCLRIPQSGRYYLYAQVYFRYPSLTHEGGDPHGGTSSCQLVQCVYKKTSYARPIQLLKGVGTKCWATDTEYALHSVYQGGLFELHIRDEIFVSVSSPTAVHTED
uniref:Tumor necrosis factor ligand superfamily member 10 n=1 Tax=Hucho hucho TaxID=62062 RepID=A0A4W5LL71_9TELE